MDFEIIDFHTHPFIRTETNISAHKDYCNMSAENTKKDLLELGISKICGSVISFHSMGEDEMDKMAENHKNVTFVAAHPGEYDAFMRHMERMKKSENYYLDVSGYGIFRHGMLRQAIDMFGSERFLFGSDYPTCNPAIYIGGVLLDNLITDTEKEYIFSKNAKRLLKI